MNLTTAPSSTSTTPLPASWVEKLLHKMLLSYGKKFTDQWGATSTDELVEHWANGLAGYTGPELAKGLKALEMKEWPPTLPDFKKMCRPPIDTVAAYYEAIAGLEARGKGEQGNWTHRAIYWAAAMMRKDLEANTFAQVKERWSVALAGQLSRDAWAEIPPARVMLPPPEISQAEKDLAAKRLRELGASGVIKGRGDDPKAWAKRILEREKRGDKDLMPIQVRFSREALDIKTEAP